MAADAPTDAGDVMASVDEAGPEPRLVIADVSREEAWVSMETDAAATLPSWR